MYLKKIRRDILNHYMINRLYNIKSALEINSIIYHFDETIFLCKCIFRIFPCNMQYTHIVRIYACKMRSKKPISTAS